MKICFLLGAQEMNGVQPQWLLYARIRGVPTDDIRVLQVVEFDASATSSIALTIICY